MDTNMEEFTWATKYRPYTVEDCILPGATKKNIEDLLKKNEVPHMLFFGAPGCGKTTLAKVIANELGSDTLFINASMEAGIDLLRTKIQSFASSVSLSETGPKLVILDECDGATAQFQSGMKGFLETFGANCRFIFTANHKQKIIEPLHSRCVPVDFKITSKDKVDIATKVMKRCSEILSNENITYDKKVLAELVKKNFPDFRKTLNDLQLYSVSGSIDSGILLNLSDDNLNKLFDYMKDKKFKEVQKWVRNNDNDLSFYRSLYDHALSKLEDQSIPQLILILADYQYKASFVADPEINTIACLVEIMSSCNFK